MPNKLIQFFLSPFISLAASAYVPPPNHRSAALDKPKPAAMTLPNCTPNRQEEEEEFNEDFGRETQCGLTKHHF
ncbi:hypothetical protein niasHS_004812 [Heterodera schachtii]|uniref:Secreted protein n=1 Tax=Heterodera schachtii TaxID=97005 RepID=A0ABD2JU12_HETSC